MRERTRGFAPDTEPDTASQEVDDLPQDAAAPGDGPAPGVPNPAARASVA